ncbi:unnamed protein product [Allacma fusca]|uniref:Uncharacterized protein n=1 Tax=Allacma fusca TaxID=39272 RepID=A0A8J2J3K4_9HEXA|nr:unnamed protein product [Allacma fusca]
MPALAPPLSPPESSGDGTLTKKILSPAIIDSSFGDLSQPDIKLKVDIGTVNLDWEFVNFDYIGVQLG